MATHLLYSFIGIFVAMDIIGILPMYLGMTKGLEQGRKKRIVDHSTLVAGAVAFSFLLIGKWIFKFLGIAMYDFKVGGGIVLLVISILDLVRGKKNDDHGSSTGIVPLAVPLITGPGLITTVMLQVSLYGNAIVLLSLLANFVFAWVVLRKGSFITRIIGEEGTDIISKIAALFMTAIAFAMIRSGIFDALRDANIH